MTSGDDWDAAEGEWATLRLVGEDAVEEDEGLWSEEEPSLLPPAPPWRPVLARTTSKTLRDREGCQRP